MVFLCAEYEKKEWCGVEWRVVRDLVKKKQEHAIMLVRFDQTHIEGLLSNDGYTDAEQRKPEELADMIMTRLSLNRQSRQSSAP